MIVRQLYRDEPSRIEIECSRSLPFNADSLSTARTRKEKQRSKESRKGEVGVEYLANMPVLKDVED